MMRLPATFDRFSSRSDGSYGLSFSTQEATAADLAMLHSHNRLFGWLVFSENQVQAEEIPKESADEEKSPSKRLRATLFVLWTQQGSKGTFEQFYKDYMEKLIVFIKGKLEPE